MIRAYSKFYLDDAMDRLGSALLHSTCLFSVPLKEFWRMFRETGFARRFETGDPSVISGMSGWELAVAVLEKAGYAFVKQPPYENDIDVPPPFWTGWALAQYQWYTAFTFDEIEVFAPIEAIELMYSPYHERDIRSFFSEMDRRYLARFPKTRLETRRRELGFSRETLGRLAEVPLRSIELYEQRRADINHIRADALYRLARALEINPDRLFERVIPGNKYEDGAR